MNPLADVTRMFDSQFQRAEVLADKIHAAACDKADDPEDAFTTQDRRAPKPKAAPRERWIVADRDGMCETLCRTFADAEATHKARQKDASTLGPWTITHYVEVTP